jgi:hypothetical protein
MADLRPHHAPGARLVAAALASTRSAHDRQRELVRASLVARPADARAADQRPA